MNKLFQMRPAEIARLEGAKGPYAVRGLIIRVSDQLSCGEISFFEVDQGEAEAAKARLEAKRAKRRKGYAKLLARLAGFEPATHGLEALGQGKIRHGRDD